MSQVKLLIVLQKYVPLGVNVSRERLTLSEAPVHDHAAWD
jgi:hypothetical protein